MDVGSKNIFQSQTRQGPQNCFKQLKYFQGLIYLGKITEDITIRPFWALTKNYDNEYKTTCYKSLDSFVNKLQPLTASSSICIKFVDLLEISFNKSE
jgi:hypothetical protein